MPTLAPSLLALGVLLLFGGMAKAQESPAVTAAHPPEAAALPSYEEYRLEQLHYLAGRSRTGVIVGGSVTAAGVALVVPAFVKECVRVASSSSFDDVRCTSRGKVLAGVGLSLLITGATTLLVTSIMLGVRRGQIRSIEDRMEYEKRRRVRFDPNEGAFTF